MPPTSDAEMTATAEEPVLVEPFRHNRWANLKLLDACAQLEPARLFADAPGTFGSIYHTLMHIVRAEEWYNFLFTGQWLAGQMSSGAPPTPAELRARAARSGERLIELARTAQPAQRVRWQEDEGEVSLTSVELLTQAIQHATEHRTHITTTLSRQGIEHPRINEWAYLCERRGAAAPRAFHLFAQ